jgi:anti-sigma B factor antagonist
MVMSERKAALMNPDANFEMAETDRGGVPVVKVQGEVDVSTAPELRERLLAIAEEGKPVVIVDLSDVSFIDSTALGVLVSALKRFRSGGGDLKLVVTEPHIVKVLEITGLTEVFEIYARSEEAVTA